MFEMFLTVMAAVAAGIYGFSKSVFMNGPHRHYYRIGLLVALVILYCIIRFKQIMRDAHLRELQVDEQEYIYYHKFTSLLYRFGYLISYLIQNILFDYTYMKRNFNFCKGLDVYDAGVGEYYIKFRNTWYRYLKLTMTRHRVSLRKLQAFAQTAKNAMIEKAASPEKKLEYHQFTKGAEVLYEKYNRMTVPILKTVPGYKKIDKYYRKNIIRYYKAVMYVDKHEPTIKDLVNRMQAHSHSDVNDFKKHEYK